MSKCPLCGSDGDDLVFKFYCSNGGCANHVVDKSAENSAPKLKWTVIDWKPSDFRINADGSIRTIADEVDFSQQIAKMLWTPRSFAREYLCQWPPSEPSHRLPKFEVQMSPYCHTYVTWREEKVPQILRQMINHVAGHTRTYGNRKDAIRKVVNDHLTRLVLNGELVWSDELRRWELHSVEY